MKHDVFPFVDQFSIKHLALRRRCQMDLAVVLQHAVHQPSTDALSFFGRQDCQIVHPHLAVFFFHDASTDHGVAFQRNVPIALPIFVFGPVQVVLLHDSECCPGVFIRLLVGVLYFLDFFFFLLDFFLRQRLVFGSYTLPFSLHSFLFCATVFFGFFFLEDFFFLDFFFGFFLSRHTYLPLLFFAKTFPFALHSSRLCLMLFFLEDFLRHSYLPLLFFLRTWPSFLHSVCAPGAHLPPPRRTFVGSLHGRLRLLRDLLTRTHMVVGRVGYPRFVFILLQGPAASANVLYLPPRMRRPPEKLLSSSISGSYSSSGINFAMSESMMGAVNLRSASYPSCLKEIFSPYEPSSFLKAMIILNPLHWLTILNLSPSSSFQYLYLMSPFLVVMSDNCSN